MAHIVLISAWQRDSESTTISKKEYKAHALLVILGQSLKRRKYFDFDAKVNNYFQEGVQSTCIAANSGSKSRMLILRLNIMVARLWYWDYVFTDRKDFIDKKKDFWLRNVTVADGDDDGGCWSISDSGHSVSPCGGDAGLVVVVAEPGGDVGGVSDKKKAVVVGEARILKGG